LKNCWTQNEILYHDSQLWVSFNELLQMNLIHEMHDQSSVDYSDILRIVKVIKRNYYWSFMWKTIDRYIWNCYICQHSKTSRNKSNDLLQSLSISEQWWQDIAMNFIIDLSDSSKYNVILTIICRLLKERHYISCITDDEDITVKKTAEMLIQWIYQTRNLSSFIVSDRDSHSSLYYESFFANDWAFLFDCSSSIILKLMIKANESIRTSSDIFNSSVCICRTTDLSDYSWSSLSTITSCSQSSSWSSSSWTRAFILIWALILTSLSMKVLANACRSIQSRIYLNKWTRH